VESAYDTSDAEYTSSATSYSGQKSVSELADKEPTEDESTEEFKYGATIDPEQEAREELAIMDLDKDGKVSLAEIEAYFKKEFYNEEFMAEQEAGPAATTTPQEDMIAMVQEDAKEFMDDMDTNKDGFLDLQEMIEQYKFDPTAPEYQDSSPEEAEDGDSYDAYKFQQEEEDEFMQTSDDEYSGYDYSDESAPEYYDDSDDFSDDSDYDFSDDMEMSDYETNNKYDEHSNYLTQNKYSDEQSASYAQPSSADPLA
jgi:hypothetical protein